MTGISNASSVATSSHCITTAPIVDMFSVQMAYLNTGTLVRASFNLSKAICCSSLYSNLPYSGINDLVFDDMDFLILIDI